MGTNSNSKKDSELLENQSRRKAVKKIVGGVSALAAYNMLPVKWDTPIIEQIFLPAHAQTSGCPECSLEDPCTITVLEGDQLTSEVIVRVDGYVTPPTAGLPVTIKVTPFTNTGESLSEPTTHQTVTDQQGMFTGTYTIAGGPGIDAVSAITTVAGADGAAGCDVTTHVEPPEENPCIDVTFIHAPIRIRRTRGVRLEGTDCAGDTIDTRIFHRAELGPTSVSLSFHRTNPEILSRVGNNDVIAEFAYLDGTTDTVDCRNQTILPLTNVVTVTFTAVADS